MLNNLSTTCQTSRNLANQALLFLSRFLLFLFVPPIPYVFFFFLILTCDIEQKRRACEEATKKWYPLNPTTISTD